MITIVEQLSLLIDNKKITKNDTTIVENTINPLCYILSLVQDLLDYNLKTLKIPEILFRHDLTIDPEIAYLLSQYSKKLSAMYRLIF